MKIDHLTYRRATHVCLLGLLIQTAMGVLMLLYAFYAKDHAAMTAAGLIGAGVLVWIVLAILFDQHRRERIEAVEIEAMADGDAGSVFESSASELRVSARRLASVERFLLPAASVLYGLGFVAFGLWRFGPGRNLYAQVDFPEPRISGGWGMAAGLAMAFVGFVFARFVSGMGKQRAWAPLRAGGSAAVGGAVLGFLLALALFVEQIGPDAARRWIVVVFPAVVMLLGAEVLLNCVLDLYRPRKAGEIPTPAFGSRVLGFVAAPDVAARSLGEALEYQFGFEVRSTWIYRFMQVWVPVLTVFGLLIAWGLSCIVVLEPHQRGMLLRSGEVISDDLGPGLHLKRPWPFETVVVPEYIVLGDDGRSTMVARTATGVRVLDLGTPPGEPGAAVIWTKKHAREEVYFLCQPASGGVGDEERDVALVAVEAPLHYVVSDVRGYDEFAVPDDRDRLLKAVAQREMMLHLSSLPVDEVVGPGRADVAAELHERIDRRFGSLAVVDADRDTGAGVDVLFVGLEDVHPPRKVAEAYLRVVQAEQARQQQLYDAQGERIQTLTEVVGSVALAEQIVGELDELDAMNASGADESARAEQLHQIERLLTEAGGEAASTIATASAERWTRHMGERGRARRYLGQLQAFRAAPLVYQSSLYFGALREAFADARLYITNDTRTNLNVRVELQDSSTTANVFNPADGLQE